jgi:glycine C-acetyltransferase
MYGKIKEHLQKELQTIEDNGILKKKESLLHQGAEITISTGETVLNFVPIII